MSRTNNIPDNPKVALPKVTMPSGGGALRGISEPFKSESFTGAGGFSVPFSLPAGRDFAPSLSLHYNTGTGNGLFGLGFSISLDSIVRKTSLGIPRYDDTDVFILGSEGELLPKYTESDKGWHKLEDTYPEPGNGFKVVAYRPRIEGSFSIIEHWIDSATGQTSHWKVLTADNITHLFGISDNGRIYNPQQPGQIFEWLIESSSDSHGNKIIYNYKPGDTVNIPQTPYNTGRDFSSQRYPDTILYGNYFYEENSRQKEAFAFKVIFDYGQIDKENPDATPASWAARPDPFSTYKSGFEIRTARLCHGIFLQHYFAGENNGQPFTTSALLPEYEQTPYSAISVIKRISTLGYRIQSDQSLWIAGTPPAVLTYQDFTPAGSAWQLLEADAPGYLNSGGFMPVDLDGIGIDGLLYSTDTFTGYLEPLGNGKYAPVRALDNFPVFRNFQSGQVTLTSLDGNKVVDLVVSDGLSHGFFEQEETSAWKHFQPFQNFPEEYLSGERELSDLSGTGRADIFFPGSSQSKFYLSEGKIGFADACYAFSPPGFPLTEQSGLAELTGFSDFIGDGLSHRFRLSNGNLLVWPCLGHGRFGEAVVLTNAPQIEGLFDATRVFLVDADGSGATDIVYCYPGFARIWFNQDGNTFSGPVDITFPATWSAISSVTAGDVTGYGTTSLIFTVTDPEVRHFYYDFSNGLKPYLLQAIDNGAGGSSALTYTTSVIEQLTDKQQGRIWPTRLPMPVSVVSQSTVTDHLTGAVYTSRYRYHDGYFDPVEREFRGFGYVETWDCESYEAFQSSAVLKPKLAELLNKELWAPPVYTRSWFITGAYQQTPAICTQYQSEFFQGDAEAWVIPAFELDPAWTLQDGFSLRLAYASLAGRLIRTETYAEDNSSLQQNPYTVSMSSAIVRLIQPRIVGRYCCVMPLEAESLSYSYDRNPQDPRISQNLVLAFDRYGHPLQSAAVSYPRRDVPGALIYPEQQQLHMVVRETAYINSVNIDYSNPMGDWQYIGVIWEQRTWEIGNVLLPQNGPFTRTNLLRTVQSAIQNAITAGEQRPQTVWSRLLGWERIVYWNDGATAPLNYGKIGPQALINHTETAVLAPDEITVAFGDKVNDEMLTNNCGYVSAYGYWWNFGLTESYNGSNQFYTPASAEPTIAGPMEESILNANGFGGSSSVAYDPYILFIVQTTSVLSDTISIVNTYQYDYQSLGPQSVTDANNNISEVLFDPLGRVIATSVYGEIGGKPTGDLPLSQYEVQKTATFNDVINNPSKYLQGATTYFYYDLFAWDAHRQPLNNISIGRMTHVRELLASGRTEDECLMPMAIGYSDGLGAALQSKSKTTPGNTALRVADGVVINNSPAAGSQQRWVVSGYTVYNNKGQPVEQYLPYFSAIPDFEDQQIIIDEGLVPPPSIIHYDPIGRVVRTDSPKGFFSQSVYTPWETKAFDFNDTMPDSPYYKWFMANYPAEPQQWQAEELAALNAALPCYNTPVRSITDNLGNVIRTINSNLGAVTASSIPAEIVTPMSPADAWNALISAGYLAQQNPDDANAWVTGLFQPYTPGFQAAFAAQFPGNGAKLEDYLAQSCMTSLGVYDIQGRQLAMADPRLFLKMVREEQPFFNFQSFFGLSGEVLRTESADAGTRWSLTNMAGNAISGWDSRGFQTQNTYDNLQRPVGVYVTDGDQQTPMANQVQITIYGETAPNAADNNLVGKPWKDFDESGLSVVDLYDLAGAPAKGETYLRPDYKSEANWTEQAQQDILSAPSYTRYSGYNAIGQLIAEILPDGSNIFYEYNINGFLIGTAQKIENPSGDGKIARQAVISNIEYDAAGKRTCINYGNGVTSGYTYDVLTQQLVRINTTRPETNNGAVLQDVYYTYDPMGHVISTIDNNSEVVYYNNQQALPRSTYAYDPLYRIISAAGRTLPGLNGEAPGDSKNSLPFRKLPSKSDLKKLENYSQRFAYDFGDNLVFKRHMAASGNRTQVMTVGDTNNHLLNTYIGSESKRSQGQPQFQYDAGGNMLVLNPGSTAIVNWNYMNQISSVTAIERKATDPQSGDTYQLNDAEYYQYNSSGNRVRKVTERAVQGGQSVEYTEKIYLGSFQLTRTWSLPAGTKPTEPVPPASEKHTIVLKDGNAPALITHIWVTVPSVQQKIKAGDVQYRYQVCDPLDSVTMEVNEAAELLTFEQYYVYGGTSFSLARSQLEADSKELRFCGKEKDIVTGLYYCGARYYADWLCRWVSPDPAGPVDGPNLYEYVRSNPVNYNDPSGMAGDDAMKADTEDKMVRVKVVYVDDKRRSFLDIKRKRKPEVKKLVRQSMLSGKQKKPGRKSYYKEPLDEKQEERYVRTKTGVLAQLKANGVALNMGENNKADESIELFDMGVDNQKGHKDNPHAEDWTTSSFRKGVLDAGDNIAEFLSSKGVPDKSANTGANVAGKDVFSLKINFSPCLGCVETLKSFKEYLATKLGDQFIFRVKFLRPYNLKSNSTDNTTDTATDFEAAIMGLTDAGIYVKIQTPESAQKMTRSPVSGADPFGTNVIRNLFKDMSQALDKSWTEMGINRKANTLQATV